MFSLNAFSKSSNVSNVVKLPLSGANCFPVIKHLPLFNVSSNALFKLNIAASDQPKLSPCVVSSTQPTIA